MISPYTQLREAVYKPTVEMYLLSKDMAQGHCLLEDLIEESTINTKP